MFFTTITIRLTTIDKQSVPKRMARITPNVSLRKLKIASTINMVFSSFSQRLSFQTIAKIGSFFNSYLLLKNTVERFTRPAFLFIVSFQSRVYFGKDKREFLFFTIGEKFWNLRVAFLFRFLSMVWIIVSICIKKVKW